MERKCKLLSLTAEKPVTEQGGRGAIKKRKKKTSCHRSRNAPVAQRPGGSAMGCNSRKRALSLQPIPEPLPAGVAGRAGGVAIPSQGRGFGGPGLRAVERGELCNPRQSPASRSAPVSAPAAHSWRWGDGTEFPGGCGGRCLREPPCAGCRGAACGQLRCSGTRFYRCVLMS